MAQQNNTPNYIMSSSNGQPQILKIVNTAGRNIQNIIEGVSGVSTKPIRLFKTGQNATTFTAVSQAQIEILKSPSVITKNLPITLMAQPVQSSSNGQEKMKQIRLTPQQTLKFVPTTQKVNLRAMPSNSSIMKPMQQQQHQQQQQGVSAMKPTGSSSTPSPKVGQQQQHNSPHILDHTGGRKRIDPMDMEYENTPEVKRRKTDKVSKGLRHFSMKVCEKVRKKETTTYNEVADELVEEFANSNSSEQDYDQKNIRRRVYDALNVLMAMDIISKERKKITWKGLPCNSVQECIQLEKEKVKKLQIIREKKKNLYDLLMRQISFKNLVHRNKELEKTNGRPVSNSYIQMPFLLINTNKKTIIDCSISQDKLEYVFNFNDKFQIHSDAEVLKLIGMRGGLDDGSFDPDSLDYLKSLVPKELEECVMQIADRTFDQDSEKEGPSNLTNDDLIDSSQLDETNSRPSSSPIMEEYSEEEAESDMSSVDD